jgi:hypothetical protein
MRSLKLIAHKKAEVFSFPTVPGSGGRGQSLLGEILVILVSMVLDVLIKNIEVSELMDLPQIPT